MLPDFLFTCTNYVLAPLLCLKCLIFFVQILILFCWFCSLKANGCILLIISGLNVISFFLIFLYLSKKNNLPII